MTSCVRDFFDFIKSSPRPYHTAESACRILADNGYAELFEDDEFDIKPGGKYYCRRGDSAVIAFRVPTCKIQGFGITASHGDSPALRLRSSDGWSSDGYFHVAAERYGGMYYSSWLDRPLELCGRAIVREGGEYRLRLFRSGKGMCVIPSVAIHLNSKANKEQTLNPAVDLVPIIDTGDVAVTVRSEIARLLDVPEEQIISTDGVLSIPAEPELIGARENMIVSPRLDDLMCAYTMLAGFVRSGEHESTGTVPVYVLYDGEEIGSSIREGAESDLLPSLLRRIIAAVPGTPDFAQLMNSSMVISADNAHAVHPNHPEFSDKTAASRPNGGVTLKHSARRSYTTDGLSGAIVQEICARAGVPMQHYENRGDLVGGSTLGAIAMSKLPCLFADIGGSQLAMHSAVETAGADDVEYLVRFAEAFYASTIAYHGDVLKIGGQI